MLIPLPQLRSQTGQVAIIAIAPLSLSPKKFKLFSLGLTDELDFILCGLINRNVVVMRLIKFEHTSSQGPPDHPKTHHMGDQVDDRALPVGLKKN